MNKKEFSTRLQNALKLRNIKPIELANKSGINKAMISEYLNGKYIAKQENLNKLSKALNVNPAWLMGYDVTMNDYLIDDRNVVLFDYIMNLSKDKTEQELLVRCTILNADNQKKVLEIVNMYLKEQDDYYK